MGRVHRTGAHYCLGANLARGETELIVNAVADVLPNISQAAEPERLRSGRVNGVKPFRVHYG